MSLRKHYEEIVERRTERHARVVDEYRCPQPNYASYLPSSERDRYAKDPPLDMTRKEFIAARAFFREARKNAKERFARERVVVFQLSETNTGHLVGDLTLKEACDLMPAMTVEIALLDCWYGGVFVREDHLFFSEAALERAGQHFPMPDWEKITVNDLVQFFIAERSAALAA